MYFLKDNPVFQNLDQICKLTGGGSRVFGKVRQEIQTNLKNPKCWWIRWILHRFKTWLVKSQKKNTFDTGSIM